MAFTESKNVTLSTVDGKQLSGHEHRIINFNSMMSQNGILRKYSTEFRVTFPTHNTVKIDSGALMVDSTLIVNDSSLTYTLPDPKLTYYVYCGVNLVSKSATIKISDVTLTTGNSLIENNASTNRNEIIGTITSDSAGNLKYTRNMNYITQPGTDGEYQTPAITQADGSPFELTHTNFNTAVTALGQGMKIVKFKGSLWNNYYTAAPLLKSNEDYIGVCTYAVETGWKIEAYQGTPLFNQEKFTLTSNRGIVRNPGLVIEDGTQSSKEAIKQAPNGTIIATIL